jgi:hypothetical protein
MVDRHVMNRWIWGWVKLTLYSLFASTLLVVEAVRAWRAIRGQPLLITGLTGTDLTVQWSSNRGLFLLVMAIHAVIILFCAFALWLLLARGKSWLRTLRG